MSASPDNNDSMTQIREPARLRALRRLNLLDTAAEEAFDRISRLATRLLDVPIALVSLVDANRQFFKSAVGLAEPWASSRETPLPASFCKHVVASGEPLVLDDAREHPSHCFNEAIRELGVVAYLGCPLTTADGHVLGSFCIIHTEPHRWTEAEIGIVRDLARSVMTEIGLRAASAELEASLRVRDKVLAIVSHDLRSPLQTIATAAAILELDADDDAQRAHIGSIQGSAGHMKRMISDLLDASTLELGKLTLEPEVLLIDELLEEVALSLSARAEERSLTVEHSADPRLTVLADRDRIPQVLLNLADNALRLTPTGGVIELCAERVDDEIVVSVADTGPGVPAAELPRIFDWYWHAATADGGGTGLGLSIAKGIVEAHGGRIWAENRAGGGARFSFALPAAGERATGADGDA